MSKLGIGKWFKKNWIGLVVGGFIMTLITAVITTVIAPHVASIWPVSTPVVVSAPRSDYSVPQASPYIGGVSSSEMSINNYVKGVEIDGSATIFNNQTTMSPYIIQAVVPTSGLRDGYVAAPEDVANWVTFDTGSTILIAPNSKVTVKIMFKIPSSYRSSLPKNWQFDISVVCPVSSAAPVNTPMTNQSVTVNFQTEYLFRWLISMKY
jgi:hypothetical protein